MLKQALFITISLLPFALMSQAFSIDPISDQLSAEMYDLGTIADDAPLPANRLSVVNIIYVDFEGQDQTGKIVVMDVLASSTLALFKELYDLRFPLAKVKLITAYKGSDDLSMADNNTSAHNFRKVAGTTRLSLHAYGTAIDINPVQNPYILIDQEAAKATFLPPNSTKYANRLVERLGKPRQIGFAEEVVDVFARHGFYWWGGYWDEPIDYQHFQLDRDVSYILSEMDPASAQWFFDSLRNYYNQFQTPLETKLKANSEISLLAQFQKSPDDFKKWVEAYY
ncbi:MAG: hypothetical protein ACJAZM_000323 [Cyclobacteriaceae bacterium]|jgi:hypothetical protein